MTVRDYPTGDYEESHGILLILNILMNVSEGEVFDLGLMSAMEGFTSKSPLDSVEEPFRFFSCLKSDDFRQEGVFPNSLCRISGEMQHSDDLSDAGDRRAGPGLRQLMRNNRKTGYADSSREPFHFPGACLTLYNGDRFYRMK
jgi:hypothetical protein